MSDGSPAVHPLVLSALPSHITDFQMLYYKQHTRFYKCLQMSRPVMHPSSSYSQTSVPLLCALTIAGNERPVESAVRVKLAAFGRSFAGRPLHVELVFVEGALLSAIQ